MQSLDPARNPWMRTAETRAVLDALTKEGGTARFVGGAVRNALLGRPVADIDIATPLLPDDVTRRLEAAGITAHPTGIEHGTITAVANDKPFEVTTLRRDVTTDGRRATVAFTDDWAEDAKRRDFTINALYASPDGELFDYADGLADIGAGRVRFIGNAVTRIREDYLRILRFFRFTAGYGRDIDEPSLNACVALSAGIAGLSGERIWQELIKTLALPDPVVAFDAMQRTGIMPQVLPGWRLAGTKVAELRSMAAQTCDAERRLLALIDAGLGLAPEAIDTVQARLKFPMRIRDRLIAAGRVADRLGDEETPVFARLIYRFGREAVEDAVHLLAAHQGQSPAVLLDLLAGLDVPAFPLRGADLIARGLTRGPEVGQRLKQIETEWVNNDFSQTVIDRSLDEIGKQPKL